MSNIESLYSKSFKGDSDEFNIKAKGKKLHLFIEERENIAHISIYMKGKKNNIHMMSTYSPSEYSLEVDTFKDETYKIEIKSGSQMVDDASGGRVIAPCAAVLSGIWEV
ncbi:MAG: hypothetical protein JXQ95_04760 [Alteromonas stellipolaris]|uniref:hypothetical protein n=1 Tax=Alteromonas stellipolaris TaxID=233316 RepID=UPI003B8B1849